MRRRPFRLPADTRALELAGLLVVLLVAAVLRVYRLPELLIVGPDQGRDALLITDMLRTGEPILQGSPSMAMTFHRGPAFYYLLAPAYAITGGHPIGGALLTAALDIGAIAGVFGIGRALAGPVAALVASGLWAVSPVFVSYGRNQWNPQWMTFFAVVSLYACLRIARGDGRWLWVLAPAWFLSWQMHEQALLLAPLLIAFLARHRRVWARREHVVPATVFSIIVLAPYTAQQVSTGLADVVGVLRYLFDPAVAAADPPAVVSPIDRITSALTGLVRALPQSGVAQAIVLMLISAGIIWALRELFRRRSVAAAFVLLYAATPLLYVAWRAPFEAHYLFAIYPVPLILAGVGAALVARLRPPVVPIVMAIVLSAVLTVSAGHILGELATRPVTPLAWERRVALARGIVADSDGHPFAFRLETAREHGPIWPSAWVYALRYAGADLRPEQPGVPTYVVFEPPDHAGAAAYGGVVVDDVRWVRFDS